MLSNSLVRDGQLVNRNNKQEFKITVNWIFVYEIRYRLIINTHGGLHNH